MSEELLKELEQMTNYGSDPEPEPTDPPSTSEPSTEEPSTEEPSTEEPSTDAPSTDAPDDKDQVIESLRKRLDEYEAKKTPTTEAPQQLSIQEFITDEDTAELVDDPKKLNELLNKVYQQAVLDTEKVTSKKLFGQTKSIVETIITLKEASDNFYKDNPDLANFKGAVASVFDELSTKNPDKSFSDIFEMTAADTRKRLSLKPPTQSKPKAPKLPGKRSNAPRPKGETEVDPLQNEIDFMNKTLRS